MGEDDRYWDDVSCETPFPFVCSACKPTYTDYPVCRGLLIFLLNVIRLRFSKYSCFIHFVEPDFKTICNCSETGSLESDECDPFGRCFCKDGYKGNNCDECENDLVKDFSGYCIEPGNIRI